MTSMKTVPPSTLILLACTTATWSVYGTFTRSFSLPRTVDATKVTATYKDGVLEVSVPKVETAKPKEIEIKAA
jgi:HSP20 family protein